MHPVNVKAAVLGCPGSEWLARREDYHPTRSRRKAETLPHIGFKFSHSTASVFATLHNFLLHNFLSI